MSYLTQSHIAADADMYQRLAQCAASEGFKDPGYWASVHNREWAASPGWDSAWESALASHEGDPDYKPGADEAVITDAMVLSEVQTIGDD